MIRADRRKNITIKRTSKITFCNPRGNSENNIKRTTNKVWRRGAD